MPPKSTLSFCLLATVLAFSLVLGACGPDLPPTVPPPSPAPVRSAFVVNPTNAVDPDDRPEAGGRAAEESAKVAGLLNSYYDIAFVDPKRWVRGTHPELAGLFLAEAHPSLAPNLGALALADLAPRVTRVVPSRQEAAVTFFIEPDLSAPVGVATVAFEANARQENPKRPELRLSHQMTLWLMREGDQYRILGYSAQVTADELIQSGRGGVTPTVGGSP